MASVTRRELLLGSAMMAGTSAVEVNRFAASLGAAREVGKVDEVASGVYFHQGNIAIGHCNNGWVVFDDYVLVIDANFPSGAEEIIPKIRALTDKPIRFAFDTHHHGDHAYGNQIWVEQGATPVAHTGVIEEMKKYETGYYGGQPGRWEQAAQQRPDVKASRLKPPTLLFPRELIFDDGRHRVELIYLGVAHTHGDAVAWLPKEKILYTGDACVNGPYNYVGDGEVEKWIATLEAARRLGASIICPGHGPRGNETVLADQQAYFRAVRERVGRLVREQRTPQQIRDSIVRIKSDLMAENSIRRYVSPDITPHIEKVYAELTGRPLPAGQKASRVARENHARQHGHEQGHHHGRRSHV